MVKATGMTCWETSSSPPSVFPDEGNARDFLQRYLQPLLGVLTEAFAIYERRGTGDRQEPDADPGLLQRFLFLSDGLERSQRQDAGDGPEKGVRTDRFQDGPALSRLGKQAVKQSLVDRRFDRRLSFCSQPIRSAAAADTIDKGMKVTIAHPAPPFSEKRCNIRSGRIRLPDQIGAAGQR